MGVGLPAGSQAVPPDGLDVSEQVSVRIFAQKTENRSPPGEREMQGSKCRTLLGPEGPEALARTLRFTGGYQHHTWRIK